MIHQSDVKIFQDYPDVSPFQIDTDIHRIDGIIKRALMSRANSASYYFNREGTISHLKVLCYFLTKYSFNYRIINPTTNEELDIRNLPENTTLLVKIMWS